MNYIACITHSANEVDAHEVYRLTPKRWQCCLTTVKSIDMSTEQPWFDRIDDHSQYSDRYKELHGVRPRGFNPQTQAEYDEAVKVLDFEYKRQVRDETYELAKLYKKRQQEAYVAPTLGDLLK